MEGGQGALIGGRGGFASAPSVSLDHDDGTGGVFRMDTKSALDFVNTFLN